MIPTSLLVHLYKYMTFPLVTERFLINIGNGFWEVDWIFRGMLSRHLSFVIYRIANSMYASEHGHSG